MARKLTVALATLALGAVMAIPAFAQDATPEAGGEAGGPPGGMQLPPPPEGAEVVASGLNGPRDIVVADGVIYVAETGQGGEFVIAGGPEGDAPFGLSGAVTAITGADVAQVVAHLPSIGGEGLGASGLAVAEDQILVAVNGIGPGGLPPSIMGSVLVVDKETGRIVEYVDLAGFEAANDPDGHGFDSNPVDIEIGPDGTVYIVETGSNAIYTWTEAGVEVFHVWPENPVPTAVDFDADGNLVVSFLGTEIAPGAARVEILSPEGEVLESFEGYNALTDVAVAEDGTIYAVSIFAGFGEQGPLPGQIVTIDADGGEVVVDGLFFPYGIAIDENGDLLVTTGTIPMAPGAGSVLRFAAGE